MSTQTHTFTRQLLLVFVNDQFVTVDLTVPILLGRDLLTYTGTEIGLVSLRLSVAYIDQSGTSHGCQLRIEGTYSYTRVCLHLRVQAT